jgi:hypothetical protein
MNGKLGKVCLIEDLLSELMILWNDYAAFEP